MAASDLSGNYLYGEMPDGIYNISTLKVVLHPHSCPAPPPREHIVDLSHTHTPSHVSHRQAIHLGGNFLSGTISHRLSELQLLERLHLDNNNFAGYVPNTVTQLRHLKHLMLGDNLLQGTLPSDWSSLTQLTMVSMVRDRATSLSLNMALKLPRPLTLCQTSSHLTPLCVSQVNNALEGVLPDLSQCTLLEIVDFSYNVFVGDLPSFVQQPHLRQLSLQYVEPTHTHTPSPQLWWLTHRRACCCGLPQIQRVDWHLPAGAAAAQPDAPGPQPEHALLCAAAP